MRSLDDFLTRKARPLHAKALVWKEVADDGPRWLLEIPGRETIGLGTGSVASVIRALQQLRDTWGGDNV